MAAAVRPRFADRQVVCDSGWRGEAMPSDSDPIENPATGERIAFRKRSAGTDGALLEFELALEPRPAAVPEHIHARQEEHIEVMSGTVLLRLGGKEQRLATGAAKTLPVGVAHTLWNDGEQEAHLVVQVRPALRTELAIKTLFGLARDGKTNKHGSPNPLQGALLAREYETFLGWPPVPVQKALLILLVPVARLLGYRATYPQYSGSQDN
jgi:mannose-6-phosphate isomerase-like protein (cupin superfamily)